MGAEFKITWNNYRSIFVRVDEVVEEEHYKRLVQNINTEPTDMEYSFVYHFYKVSIDDSTCLKLEITYEGGKGVQMKRSHMEALSQEREDMMKRFQHYFNKVYKAQCKQFESLIYDCKVKDLWKIVTNWKIFKKLVPEICEEIQHNNDNTSDNFTVVWNKTKSKISSMKVLKSEYNENDNIYEHNLLCFNNPPEIPDQELHFKIIKVNNCMCLLEYKHVFLMNVDSESLSKVSAGKKNILLKLKNSIQKLKLKKKDDECGKVDLEGKDNKTQVTN